MTISQLASSASVGVETVRFYQRRGLLNDPRPSRQVAPAGRRHYSEDDARRLRFIRKAQKAGFTLSEIARLLELDATADRATANAMARDRLAALDLQIAELEASRRALERLAQLCAGTGQGPCPIIEAFDG